MRPRIYIYYHGSNLSFYQSALDAAGGIALFSTDLTVAKRCDGLLLPGGGDIDPARYGQKRRGTPRLNPTREAAEFALIDDFVQSKKPIFGICLGLQMLNVAFGGTLLQAIPKHEAGERETDCVHLVHAAAGSLLDRLYSADFLVNSFHRQAVDRLGEGLAPIGAAADGVIEAVQHETLPIVGVQWHPERNRGSFRRPDLADGQALFNQFVAQMR
ncbi:MAG: gamma-glutamyl-gamma-aminobutyrate hydrolase family protein [Oscillospiraceae bacterium]